jgi:hypothetical protein
LNVSDEISAAVALRTASASHISGPGLGVSITTLQLNPNNDTNLHPPSSRKSTFKTTLSAPPAKAVGIFHGSPIKGSSSGNSEAAPKSWLTNSEPSSLHEMKKEHGIKKISETTNTRKEPTSFKEFMIPIQAGNDNNENLPFSKPVTPRNDENRRSSPGGLATGAKRATSFVTKKAIPVVVPTTVTIPSSNPAEEYRKSVAKLKGTSDWQVKCQCMESIKTVFGQVSLSQQDLHSLVLCILDEVSNLRSSVSRVAIFTLTEICQTSKRSFDPEIDTVVNVLMKKAGDGNQFIHEAIDNCLLALCNECNISKVTSSLLHHIDSKNQLARQKVAFCFTNICEGKPIVWNTELEKIIILGLVPLAFDSAVETRQICRRTLVQLSLKYHAEFYRLIDKSFTELKGNEIKEAIELHKKRGSTAPSQKSKITFFA